VVLVVAAAAFSLAFTQISYALTASYGRPYQGHLENGVVFPNQFPGYHLRDESRSYTTPEVVGALLDAIEAVRTQFPDTCDVFLGDFSCQHGGSAIHHRSHQNGRDVDVGMYAKGNRPLSTFVPMSEENLDAAKTWCLIENLIASQRVQYIFLDRHVQKVIYEYAASRGYDQEYLQRVFGNVRGSLIQHVRNHVDHMHVRFFTPWSTLAAHIETGETEKAGVIEAAQESYLPRKVNYYVNGSEKGLDELARSFGVSLSDLCKWNHLSPSSVIVPGSCLVFYKRSFESEPVLLARSLQPGFIARAAPAVQMASFQPEPVPASLTDSTFSKAVDSEEKVSAPERPVRQSSSHQTCKARRGDTLEKIARRNNLDVGVLCKLNGIKRTAPLKPGQTVKTGTAKTYASGGKLASASNKGTESSSSICFASDSKKPGSPTAAFYTMNKGGTLMDVSKKTGIPLSSLSQLNGLSRSARLKAGQRVKLTQANLPVRPSLGKASCSISTDKKSANTRHDKAKKSLKPGEKKAAQKPVAKSGASKDSIVKSNTKAAPSKASSGKISLKQPEKTGKPGPSAVHKKASNPATGAKTAAKSAKPGKNTTIAKK
jgi:LysM repeat protein/murein endopeptidase